MRSADATEAAVLRHQARIQPSDLGKDEPHPLTSFTSLAPPRQRFGASVAQRSE